MNLTCWKYQNSDASRNAQIEFEEKVAVLINVLSALACTAPQLSASDFITRGFWFPAKSVQIGNFSKRKCPVEISVSDSYLQMIIFDLRSNPSIIH